LLCGLENNDHNAARPIDPATTPNASRPYSERGSRRLESKSSPSLWRPAPHVIGPPTTEMTKLPPLELYFITQTHQSVPSLLYDSGEAHTLRLFTLSLTRNGLYIFSQSVMPSQGCPLVAGTSLAITLVTHSIPTSSTATQAARF